MKKNELVALILNIVLLIFGVIGLITSVSELDTFFLYYTQDSALICIISSLFFVIFMLIKKSIKEMPKFVMILRYLGTCSSALTFLVVTFVLVPMTVNGMSVFGSTANNLWEAIVLLFTSGSMLYFHLIVPVLSFISFVFFESDRRLNRKNTVYYGMLLTIVYTIVMVPLNILNVVKGPYPFLLVYEQPIWASVLWCVGILAFDYFKDRFILYFNQRNAAKKTFKKS